MTAPPVGAPEVSNDEVRALIEQGLHAGSFNQAEQQMVTGVLELDELSVTVLMTPRPKIVFLNLDDSDEVNWRKIVTSGHSRFPVYQSNRDQVIGVVAVKAIWANSAFGLSTHLRNLVALDGVSVTAASSRSEESLAAAKAIGGQSLRIYSDWREVVALEDLDAIVVALTTYVQTKLTTPPTANPNDQTAAMTGMMAIYMPLLLGWFALTFPSGLAVYFITSNLLGIAQYAMMGRANWRNLLPGGNKTAAK